MLNGDAVTRDLVAEMIRGAVDEIVSKQLLRRAQEPPISSKVAQAIEERLNGVELNNYRISVVAQDFPDRGPGSWEEKSGADLYVGIEVRRSRWPPIAKGLLIQAKKARPFRTVLPGPEKSRQSIGKDHIKLLGQCGKMLNRSDKGSFIWVYRSGGTYVVPASEVVAHQTVPPEYLAGRRIDEQFRDVLDCVSGDKSLAIPEIFEDDVALGGFLEELAVRRGVAIMLSQIELG